MEVRQNRVEERECTEASEFWSPEETGWLVVVRVRPRLWLWRCVDFRSPWFFSQLRLCSESALLRVNLGATPRRAVK